MGFGNAVYRPVLESLGHEIITVDPYTPADFKTVDAACIVNKSIDTVHVCTPNYTHESVARQAAEYGAKIVFVEKPGVQTSKAWRNLVRDYPNTRFMMVKNNQYRDEINHFKDLAGRCEIVQITWNNNNRIPRPGSWFTDRELAFGGVSRDLIPHMLSYYCAFTDYKQGVKLFAKADQRWKLSDIDSSDYGPVYPDGVYNVDDFCELEFKNNNTRYVLTANWRTLEKSEISISFGQAYSSVRHELGLCPESAYQQMIATAVKNINNDAFWQDQLNQDTWIHQQIEKL